MPKTFNVLKSVSEHVRWRFRSIKNPMAVGFVVLILVVFVFGGWFVVECWDWLQSRSEGSESNGETLRNAGLLLGGVVALIFGIWRALAADRQANAAQRQADAAQAQVSAAQAQVDAAQAQVDTAQRTLHNERYQKGAEMLGSRVLSVRLGGIYALQSLAEEHPNHYHIQIMRLFCSFVLNPTPDDLLENKDHNVTSKSSSTDDQIQLRQDVQSIMEAISTRTDKDIDLEKSAGFRPDLSKANLSGLKIGDEELNVEYNLSRVIFWDADLSNAVFVNTDLSNTWYGPNALLNPTTFGINTNLTGAAFIRTDMSKVEFYDTNLSGTQFSIDGVQCARNLTQTQLNNATADPNNPPNLDGLTDANGTLLEPPDEPPQSSDSW